MEEGFRVVPAFQKVLRNGEATSLSLPAVIAAYDWAISQDPGSPFLSFALGEAHRLRGNGSEADRHYDQGLSKAKGVGEHVLLIELFEKRDR